MGLDAPGLRYEIALSDLAQRLAARSERFERLGDAWVRGPRDTVYQGFVGTWFVACLARLTLFGELSDGWWLNGVLLIVGAAGLLRFGGRVWWAISLIALAWPYFFLRDWMTQSLVMMLIAAVGLVVVHARSASRILRGAAHLLVASTYWVAAFHKTNRDFFDAELSCATYGWEKLTIFFESIGLAALGVPGTAVAIAVVVTELTIGALLLTRVRWGILLGLAFHVPLTLVLAPAFAFVMAIGYAAALTEEDWRALARTGRTRWRPIAAVTISALLLPVVGDSSADLLLTLKVALMAFAFACVALTPIQGVRPGSLPRQALVAPALFLLIASTPYLGTQYQHTGAMLSNLRIDEGCWNHLLVPEAARLVDPYLRIDEAHMGPPGVDFSERETVLEETLWQMSALRLVQENWCRDHTRPIALRGTYMGGPFEVVDLCDEFYEVPRGVGVLGGPEWLRDLLKFQKNLARECPTACVH